MKGTSKAIKVINMTRMYCPKHLTAVNCEDLWTIVKQDNELMAYFPSKTRYPSKEYLIQVNTTI